MTTLLEENEIKKDEKNEKIAITITIKNNSFHNVNYDV